MCSGMILLLLPAMIGGFEPVFSPVRVGASVIPPRIAQLAEASDVIVIARVESVTGRPDDGNRRAKAAVIEVWKGAKVTSVEYRVSPTFACDISDAKEGETVLLFLAKDEETGWGIVWAGRGRMPLLSMGGKEYLTHFGDVIFPGDTPQIEVAEKEDDGFDSAVELKLVKELVRKAFKQTK